MIRILSLFSILLLFGCKKQTTYTETSNVQLATPLINGSSLFATKNNKIEAPYLDAGLGLEVHSIEGKKRTVFNSKENIALDEIGTYRLRTVNPPFLPSEWVELKVLPEGKAIESIDWITDPKPNYFKGGSAVLIDGKSADFSFHSKGWTGANNPFGLKVQFDTTTRVDSLTLGVLFNPSAWIYPISELQIKIQKDRSEVILKDFDFKVEGNLNEQKHAFVSFAIGEEANEIQMDFIPKNLPEEHPGAGTPTWLFLDELIIY